jgi:hypothetical protein
MKVISNNQCLSLHDLNTHETELLLECLVRFANVTLTDRRNEAKTAQERQSLSADKRTAHMIYRAIDSEFSKIKPS